MGSWCGCLRASVARHSRSQPAGRDRGGTLGVPDETAAVANLLTPGAWAPHGQPAYNDVYVEVRPVAAAIGEPIADRLTIPVA